MRVQSWLLLADHDFIDGASVVRIDTDSLALVVDERVVQVVLNLYRLQQTSHTTIGKYDILGCVVDPDEFGSRIVGGWVFHSGNLLGNGGSVDFKIVFQSSDNGCASFSVIESIRKSASVIVSCYDCRAFIGCTLIND